MSKIKALCVRDKEATLLDETGKHGAVNRQWISCRRGMYLIEGLQLRYTEQGTPYISAYDGFFIQGILIPFPPNKMLEADVEAVKALAEAADEE